MLKSTDKTVAGRLLKDVFLSQLHIRLLMLGIGLLAAAFGLLGPFFQKEFIDHLSGETLVLDNLYPGLQSHLPDSAIAFLGLAFVCILLSMGCSQLVIYLGAREAVRLQRKWSQELYEKILSLRSEILSQRPVGEIVAIYTTDLQGATILLEQSLPQALSIICPLVLAPFLIVGLFRIPISSAAGVMVAVVLLNLSLAIRQSRFFYRFKQLAADRVGLVNEWVQNIRTLRILRWTADFEKKIIQVRAVETQNRVAMLNNGQFMNALASSITFVLNVVLIETMVHSEGAKITPGSLLALLWIVAVFLTRPFRQMPWFFTFVFDGLSSLNRTASLLGKTDSQGRDRPTEFQKVKDDRPGLPALEVQNLSLQLGGQAVLNGLSFRIQSGEFVAVVGEVGAGKSQLLLSLLGETSAHFQAYNLGSNNAQNFPLAQLRQYFTYIPQDGFIMSSSLRDNVAFNYDVDQKEDRQILRSLAHAQFAVVQERLPEGLETQVGERGVNLSGGQKQRVSLARVDYFQAPILLLDDCLSALDVDTEQKVMNTLVFGEWKNSTRILATHRLSVLEKADRILFLQNGELVGNGHYQKLLSENADFRSFTASVQKQSQQPGAGNMGPQGVLR